MRFISNRKLLMKEEDNWFSLGQTTHKNPNRKNEVRIYEYEASFNEITKDKMNKLS